MLPSSARGRQVGFEAVYPEFWTRGAGSGSLLELSFAEGEGGPTSASPAGTAPALPDPSPLRRLLASPVVTAVPVGLPFSPAPSSSGQGKPGSGGTGVLSEQGVCEAF